MKIIQKWLSRHRGRKEYARKLLSALDDLRLDEPEKAELSRIVEQHLLRPKDTLNIQRKAFGRVFDLMAVDRKITDNEKAGLEDIIRFFGRSLNDLKFDQDSFNKFHILARVETGVLIEIEREGDLANLVLKNGEVLHWACCAATMKRKKVTTRVNYSGVTASIKIMKGVRYRVGSINYRTVSSEFVTREDTGFLWLSNYRIGFKGPRKHFSVAYSKISSFEISDGVLNIFKEGRENPHMVFLTDYDITCSILSMILNPKETMMVAETGK